MIPIGVWQELKVDRIKSHGAYLTLQQGTENEDMDVLLPKKEVGARMKPGDTVMAFVYRDSDERKIATLRKPKIVVGEAAVLQVKDITRIGAFLDWGLEKDLLLPFAEQNGKVKKGQEVFVRLYVDKSDRLAASQKMQGFLQADSPYHVDDWVEGRVIGRHPKIGAFVAVDDKYEALLPEKNIYRALEPMTALRFRVQRVQEDGRLILSLRDRAEAMMDTDAEQIRNALKEANGFLPVDDNTDPDTIRNAFGMSKSAFKRALGRLLKSGEIRFARGGIRINNKEGGPRGRRQNYRKGRR